MQATARIFYQKAPVKRTADDKYPVKLCVTHKGTRKYYSINALVKDNKWTALSDEDMQKVERDSPRGQYKDIALEYKRIVDEAEAIINGLRVFSFNQFEDQFLNKPASWDSVFAAIIDHVTTLRNEGRIGYASSFESTLRAIKEFHEDKQLPFNCRKDKVSTRYEKYLSGKPLHFVDITPAWLVRFEAWMTKQGKGTNTSGIYVRNIRTLFNLALEKHNVKADNPFPSHRPKQGKGRKIALTALQISLIANYKTADHWEQYYRDVFMFSFLANGMNLSDIARLRYSNIVDGELSFVRKKTEKEEQGENPIHVPITANMQDIINRHGNRAVGHDAYLFPILRQEWTEVRNYAEIKQLTKQVNKHIRQIALKVGVKNKISSNVSRHSWATIAKNSGTSIEYISEQLGHSSMAVTKIYLDSFEKATREKHSAKIEDAIYNQKAI